MTYGTFTLTGRHTTPSGKAHAGSVVVTPNCVIRDVAGDVVMSGAEQVKLDETGAWSVVLPCDSAGLNPSEGIGYSLGYSLYSTAMNRQSFYATADLAGRTLDVSEIVTVSVPAPLSAIITATAEQGAKADSAVQPEQVDAAVAAVVGGPTSAARAALDAEYRPPTRRVRYVDVTVGDDTNTGASPAKSLKTIQAAIDALGPDGGKVLVHDGIYAPFTITTSGVELESLGGRRKTIIKTLGTSVDGVTVTGASALSTLVQTAIRGFTIAGPGKGTGTGRGLAVKWVSVDFCIEDCWVTQWGSHGIYAEDSYSATVRQTLIDNCGGDGFSGVTNINNWTFDRTISILNGGNGYAITGGTSCLFLNADAESNTKAGFDLRYVFAPTLLACHMEKNGGDGTSPNIYLHYRAGLSEKTTAANVLNCIVQGSGVTKRGLAIDGASRTTYQGNWFAGHVTEHVQTTSNADRTWIGPNTYTLGINELTDGSASSVRMDFDYSNLCARTDVLRLMPRALNPAVLAQGQLWWASGTDQFKVRDASAIRTVFTGWQATATLDFPSIAPGTVAALTVTVTGAVAGDSANASPPSSLPAGLIHSALVTAANTVEVRLFNGTAAAIDPPSAGWKINVIRS